MQVFHHFLRVSAFAHQLILLDDGLGLLQVFLPGGEVLCEQAKPALHFAKLAVGEVAAVLGAVELTLQAGLAAMQLLQLRLESFLHWLQ